MNLIVGAVIVLTLLGSELTGAQPVRHEQLWLTLFMVGVLAILVPGLAVFQTYFVSIQSPLNQGRRQTSRSSHCTTLCLPYRCLVIGQPCYGLGYSLARCCARYLATRSLAFAGRVIHFAAGSFFIIYVMDNIL